MRFRLKSGLALGYTTRGSGRSVVFLHPVGVSTLFWNPVVAELENEFRTIAIDTRGHGESDVPSGPFSMEDLAADIIELIRAVGSPPCVLVGCSMGVAIANFIALAAPDLVAGMVLAGSGHGRDAASVAMLEARAKAAEAGMGAIAESTASRWLNPAKHPELHAQVRDWLRNDDPVVHAWSWRAMRDRDYGDRLQTIRVPVLAVAGTEDLGGTPAALRAMAAVFPNGSYDEIAGAGHFAPLEEPVQFAAIVRTFIQRL